jgi:hypothetical protein
LEYNWQKQVNIRGVNVKKFLLSSVLLILSLIAGYTGYVYLTGIYSAAGIFLSGLIFGIFLMILKLSSKDSKLNLYKRELERESVSSDEAGARVKVLESKIQVLEKALENALNK